MIDRELAEQGDDVVYEPAAEASNSFSLLGRDTEDALPATPTAALSNTRAPYPQGLAAEWRAVLTFVDKDVMLFYKKHERLT